MGAFDNVREFMDRVNLLALKNFYRTKDALDGIEAGTFSTADSWLLPLTMVDDLIALWLPVGTTTLVYPPTLVIPGSRATGAAAGGIAIAGITAATVVKKTALQPFGPGMVGVLAIPAGSVVPTPVAGTLNVAINPITPTQALGTYKGLILDDTGKPLTIVELQLAA